MAKPIPFKWNLTVVGIQHRVVKDTRRMLIPHLPFRVHIEREPDNPHDENALKVVIADEDVPYDGIHLGYIPRPLAKLISPAVLDRRLQIVEAWVTEIDVEMGTAESLVKFKGSRKALEIEV